MGRPIKTQAGDLSYQLSAKVEESVYKAVWLEVEPPERARRVGHALITVCGTAKSAHGYGLWEMEVDFHGPLPRLDRKVYADMTREDLEELDDVIVKLKIPRRHAVNFFLKEWLKWRQEARRRARLFSA